ncbi:MAG: NAD-dependent epimerase/dehydratase family protein [Candidatus Omnitrophica bacterium]|nr:NAD-dependent epimerase/dehydratase family protein [Candidatus Omnitrophota bacterium]
MKIFLTGATGYLGQAVARNLNIAGHRLRCLVRRASDASKLPEDAEIVQGSLTDSAFLAAGVQGCDAVCHLAAFVQNWAADRRLFDLVNIEASERLARIAMDLKCARFLYVSSFMALGPSPGQEPAGEELCHPGPPYRNDYERSKALALDRLERLAVEGLPLITVLPGVLYGPGAATAGNHVSAVIRQLRAKQIPGLLGNGSQLWTYTYIEDAAAGVLAALEQGRIGERYLLGGPVLSMGEFARRVSVLAQCPEPRRRIPLWVGWLQGALEEMWAVFSGRTPAITRGVVNVYRRNWAFTSEKAMRELGYTLTDFDTGLKSLLRSLGEES